MIKSVRLSLIVILIVPEFSSATRLPGFANHLILFNKGNYIAYGHGRSSERDLPECSSSGLEACNLRHDRFWKPPLLERLCRCPGHTPCPVNPQQTDHSNATRDQILDGEESAAGRELLVQHISNRAQLHFCNVPSDTRDMQQCINRQVGLEVTLKERYALHNSRSKDEPASQSYKPAIITDSFTHLKCRCEMPRYWKHRNTQLKLSERERRDDPQRSRLLTQIHNYVCDTLPACGTNESCSAVRPDTYESYFTCSCPVHHLCLVPRGAQAQRTTSHTYPHHYGRTLEGVCTPHYPPQPPRNYG